MKMTLDIDDELLNEAKSLSIREHKPLKVLVEEGLRLRLRSSCLHQSRRSLSLPVYRGKSGLATGIDPTTLR
jgi:hypothetical protein